MSNLELDYIVTATIKYQIALLEKESDCTNYYKDIFRKIHDCLYNWIVYTKPSPKRIIALIIDLKSIEGFMNELDLVSITCFQGISIRSPKAIEGSWEDLIMTINYINSDDINTILHDYSDIITLNCIYESLPKYYSSKLCSNPCVRLELFRIMHGFGLKGDVDSYEAFISTLCELHDKFANIEETWILSGICKHFLMYWTHLATATRGLHHKWIKDYGV